jgi:hypothetical protein
VLDGDVLADHAWVNHLAIQAARQLTGGASNASVDDHGQCRLGRQERTGQLQPELFESGIDAARGTVAHDKHLTGGTQRGR